MFGWMVWTTPVAVFFACIALMLAGMTIWELRSPTRLRKGFLPIATTRGDRLFIGLMIAAWINLAYVGWAARRWSGSRWTSRPRSGSVLCCRWWCWRW